MGSIAAGQNQRYRLESDERIAGLPRPMRAGGAATCLTSRTVRVAIEEYVKNSLQIAGGLVGAVIGFVATLLLLELVGFGNRADPIASGILALLVFAPAGAIAGLVLGTGLAMRMRGGEQWWQSRPQQPQSLRHTDRALCRGRNGLLCVCRHDRHALAQSKRTKPHFSSSRSACQRERRRRAPCVMSPSSCRPTSTRCRESHGSTGFRRDGDRSVIAGRGRPRLSHRAPADRAQDQGSARPALPHRADGQGAAYVRTWTVAATGRRQRDSLSRQMARPGLSHACPRPVCRVPGLKFVSESVEPGYRRRATHSRERHVRILPSVEPAHGCLPPSVSMVRYGRWKDCLPNTAICAVQGNQSEPWPRFCDIKSGRAGEPSSEPTPRRLAAIVAGDISGYSRLMQIDEEGTHTRVKRIERDLIEPSISRTPRQAC